MTDARYIRGIPAFRLLVAKRANVNARNNFGVTPLHVAASGGNEYMVGFLLRKGADPSLRDGDGVTALDTAVRTGHRKIVSILDASAAGS